MSEAARDNLSRAAACSHYFAAPACVPARICRRTNPAPRASSVKASKWRCRFCPSFRCAEPASMWEGVAGRQDLFLHDFGVEGRHGVAVDVDAAGARRGQAGRASNPPRAETNLLPPSRAIAEFPAAKSRHRTLAPLLSSPTSLIVVFPRTRTLPGAPSQPAISIYFHPTGNLHLAAPANNAKVKEERQSKPISPHLTRGSPHVFVAPASRRHFYNMRDVCSVKLFRRRSGKPLDLQSSAQRGMDVSASAPMAQ